jgi:hypothetical protein
MTLLLNNRRWHVFSLPKKSANDNRHGDEFSHARLSADVGQDGRENTFAPRFMMVTPLCYAYIDGARLRLAGRRPAPEPGRAAQVSVVKSFDKAGATS